MTRPVPESYLARSARDALWVLDVYLVTIAEWDQGLTLWRYNLFRGSCFKSYAAALFISVDYVPLVICFSRGKHGHNHHFCFSPSCMCPPLVLAIPIPQAAFQASVGGTMKGMVTRMSVITCLRKFCELGDTDFIQFPPSADPFARIIVDVVSDAIHNTPASKVIGLFLDCDPFRYSAQFPGISKEISINKMKRDNDRSVVRVYDLDQQSNVKTDKNHVGLSYELSSTTSSMTETCLTSTKRSAADLSGHGPVPPGLSIKTSILTFCSPTG
ncbi:hypothetical protein F5888DRAFT_1890210 [Russula emetica]|nr:hypothetical protein F5888DRAFT_1890210 [Russula emetica]